MPLVFNAQRAHVFPPLVLRCVRRPFAAAKTSIVQTANDVLITVFVSRCAPLMQIAPWVKFAGKMQGRSKGNVLLDVKQVKRERVTACQKFVTVTVALTSPVIPQGLFVLKAPSATSKAFVNSLAAKLMQIVHWSEPIATRPRGSAFLAVTAMMTVGLLNCVKMENANSKAVVVKM